MTARAQPVVAGNPGRARLVPLMMDHQRARAAAATLSVIAALTPFAASHSRPESSAGAKPVTAPPPTQAGRALARRLQGPVDVWLGPRGLYVITSPPGSSDDDTITLLGRRTGTVEARRRLPGVVVNWPHMVLSGGSLWVTVEGPGKGAGAFDLLALDAADLRARHLLALSQPAELGLAAAGGWVWVETGHYLAKVAPGTGKLAGTVALPAPGTEDLASDGAGKVLASVHFGDGLDLLNPSTGTVIAHYQGAQGDGGHIAGIAEGQVFTYTGIGHGSSFQRFDIAHRRFYGVYGWGYGPQLVVSGDRFLFNIYAGYGARAEAPNYCGSTATGQPLAALPAQASPPQGRAVGYANGVLYYLTPAAGTSVDLDEVALPGCR